MTTQHTPGPWSMTSPPYDSIPWHHVYGPDGKHIMHRDRPRDEKIATTFLIAAAPELLELLELCADRVEVDDPFAQELVAKARAAIARATGVIPATPLPRVENVR